MSTITFRQKFLLHLKSRILTIKIGVIFLYKNLSFFGRLNRFLYVWVFQRQISACRFLNHYVLICKFLLYQNASLTMLLFCFKPLTNNRGVARNFPVVRTLCQIHPQPSHTSFSRFDLITQFHEEISSIRATVIARLFGKIEGKHCIERKKWGTQTNAQFSAFR